jgi:drug/metabolite transporter (DMT)-like permease
VPLFHPADLTSLSPMTKRTQAELLLALVTFIWGATFVIVKDALRDSPPRPFVAIRFVFAGVLLWIVLAGGRLDRRALVPSALLGVFLFAGYAFQTWGLVFTTPSKSAFITGSSVIWVPVMLVALGRRLQVGTALGALLGFAGLYLLVVPTGISEVNRGDLLTVLAATAFAVHIVMVDRYTRRLPFQHLVPGQVLTVGVLAAVLWPFDPGTIHWTARLTMALAVTGLLATAFAFTVQNWAQQYTPPAHTALIFTLEPVFAALVSRVVLGERLGGRSLIGAFLTLGGMLVSELWGGG